MCLQRESEQRAQGSNRANRAVLTRMPLSPPKKLAGNQPAALQPRSLSGKAKPRTLAFGSSQAASDAPRGTARRR